MDEQQVPLDVVGVRVELPSSQPVLILRGIDSYDQEHHVAVVVGPAEAAAVARALQGEVSPRPMTHDLLTSVLEASGSGIASIEVRLMDSSTYAGTIRLNNGSEYDARASDSIAVAVRSQCQVTMRQETLQAVSVTPRYHDQGDDADSTSPGVSPEAQTVPRQGPISEDEIREFEKFLSEAEPEDFDRQ